MRYRRGFEQPRGALTARRPAQRLSPSSARPECSKYRCLAAPVPARRARRNARKFRRTCPASRRALIPTKAALLSPAPRHPRFLLAAGARDSANESAEPERGGEVLHGGGVRGRDWCLSRLFLAHLARRPRRPCRPLALSTGHSYPRAVPAAVREQRFCSAGRRRRREPARPSPVVAGRLSLSPLPSP